MDSVQTVKVTEFESERSGITSRASKRGLDLIIYIDGKEQKVDFDVPKKFPSR